MGLGWGAGTGAVWYLRLSEGVESSCWEFAMNPVSSHLWLPMAVMTCDTASLGKDQASKIKKTTGLFGRWEGNHTGYNEQK